MTGFRALLLAALVLPTSAPAETGPAPVVMQAAYEQSIIARAARRPDLAEEILGRLIELEPRAPQLRFDLGVALAEQGRCVAAARAFEDGKEISGTPSFERASEAAMQDLCPGLAPFDITTTGSFVYDTNANAGAGDQSISVGGVPMLLSRDAVAKESFGFVGALDLAYNLRVSTASYIVPSIGFAIADFQGSDLDSYSVSPTLSYRYQGDRVDWRIGPTAIWNYSANGLVSKGGGMVARGSFAISQRSGLFVDASRVDIFDERSPLLDYRQDSIAGTLVHNPAGTRMSLRAALAFTNLDYEDDFQDLRSWQANLGLSGSITRTIGYDLSYAYRINQGQEEHYLFGEKRHDKIQTLTGSLSFASLEGWYGRPYVGLSYSTSESSWETKTFDRTRALFGFTRRF